MERCDFLIIGGGIAGSYAGHALAGLGETVLLEWETQPGYHATGRSAAIYAETYGNRTVRALSVASRPFLDAPPAGFADRPILTPRGSLHIGRPDQRALVEREYAESLEFVPSLRLLDTEEARALVPVIRPEAAALAYLEPLSRDIDVDALHQGFLKSLRQKGGRIVTDAEATSLAPRKGGWDVSSRAGDFRADIVINAAGAWADIVAARAGLAPIGLEACRRTAFIFDPPQEHDVRRWPLVIGIDESFYFKPEAGRLLGTPADETPVIPSDIQPEEIDIATAIDRIERATTLEIPRVIRRWAGLRTFAPDRTPVVGMDPDGPGFFWLAGQGGYGMQTAPAMAAVVGTLVRDGRLPDEIEAYGVTLDVLSPARFRGVRTASFGERR